MVIRDIEAGSRAALATGRLRLERWDDSHFDDFARFMQDPSVIRYIRPAPLDRRRALEQHERSLAEWEMYGFGKRAILDAESGGWLGFTELSLVGPDKGSRDDDVELGYFVEPVRWGEGIATEAALAMRDDAFGRCALLELIGRCRVENVASARVLEKVGFRRLRFFELEGGIVVEIHHLSREGWSGPDAARRAAELAGPQTGAKYRETG
jgi:RimJ/RimL family protein N-acetyltransferase